MFIRAYEENNTETTQGDGRLRKKSKIVDLYSILGLHSEALLMRWRDYCLSSFNSKAEKSEYYDKLEELVKELVNKLNEDGAILKLK